MGTGKTTLLKNGISKLLNREIAFIALGGASDGSFLEGHSYTYEGSTYGKILDILIQCKTSNPIIYFDELDKVSDCPKGDEIIGILTHLTDTTQNSEFHDKYMSEIDIDMSKCLFIFSYNEEHKVNKILRDRMYVIETSGYNTEDKIVISKEFLIPSIQKNLCLNEGDFVFNNEILKYIIDNKTAQEKGVRNLKRNLEVIFNRINLFRLLKNEDKLFNQKIIQNIVYPFHITQDIVDILVETKKNFSHVQYMYL
jgi:ATP-dependent Lon protease